MIRLSSAAALLVLAACSGGAGPQGPAGPAGATGPTGQVGTVVFGTTAGTAAEGNDPRLSDARVPLPGSASYIQSSPAAPQAASVSVAGAGSFGGAVTAAQFSGSGAGLTSLPAAALSGTIPDAALPPDVARLAAGNAFVGTNSFSGPFSLAGQAVTNVGSPVNSTDAATKGYVDASFSAVSRPAVYFAEQTGSAVQVTSTTWTALQGVQVTFASAAAPAALRASGSVYGVASAGAVGTCGIRFVVDGTALGDATWGDALIQCAPPGGAAPGWCSWSAQRVVSLTAGAHGVGVQMVGSGSTGCGSGGGSYSNAKLSVTTY